jgi:hypothetical protein
VPEGDRFAHLETKHAEYFQVRRIWKGDLDALPSDDAFVDACERSEDEDESDVDAAEPDADEILDPDMIAHFAKVMAATSALSVVSVVRSHEALRADRDRLRDELETIRASKGTER